MYPFFVLAAALLWSTPQAPAGPTLFDKHFADETLRIDYIHSGIAREEHIALASMRIEPVWAGSRTVLEDPTGYGKYSAAVYEAKPDGKRGPLLYSRGYSTLFGEIDV